MHMMYTAVTCSYGLAKQQMQVWAIYNDLNDLLPNCVKVRINYQVIAMYIPY